MARIAVVISLGAFVLSLAASLSLYTRVAQELGNPRITDRYDDLARGLAYYGTLSYYPDREPSVARAPLFPALLSVTFSLEGESFEVLALVLQSLLHAAIVLATYGLGLLLGGKRAALVAAILCAIHPLLLWYSSRLVVETSLTLLVTLAVLAAVHYWQKPTLLNALMLGGTIGVGLWCKTVLAPFLILLPLLILFTTRGRTWRDAVALVAAGVLVFFPWLLRNYSLTDRFPLSQALVGYNLFVSDSFAEHAGESPLGYSKLIDMIDYPVLNHYYEASNTNASLAQREADADGRLTRRSLERYGSDPAFLAKKAALNAVWFWCLGSRSSVTLMFLAFQGILVFLAVRRSVSTLKDFGWKHVALLPVWLALAYYLPHIFVYSLGRFSIPLIPAFLSVAAANPRAQLDGQRLM